MFILLPKVRITNLKKNNNKKTKTIWHKTSPHRRQLEMCPKTGSIATLPADLVKICRKTMDAGRFKPSLWNLGDLCPSVCVLRLK